MPIKCISKETITFQLPFLLVLGLKMTHPQNCNQYLQKLRKLDAIPEHPCIPGQCSVFIRQFVSFPKSSKQHL